MSASLGFDIFLLVAVACSCIDSVCGQAGAGCVGHMLGKRGSCSDETVDLGDSQAEVKTYCYAPIASDMSRKAAKNVEGTCFIPREYPCDSDSQCRPGTQCLPKGKDHSLICDLGDFEQPMLDVDATLKIVHKNLYDLLDALRHREGGFMDTKTGVLSPLLAATNIPMSDRMDYVAGILSSFASGKFKDMGETSRSGATFMFSGDFRFIAKTVRPDEFVVFADELLPALCQYLPLSQTLNWPKLVASSTALNVPVVAFKNGDSHFLILPTVNTLRQEARGISENWGNPTMYDIKPLRAHSHQRTNFVRWLAESQSFPARAHGPESVRSQWDLLLKMLHADMAFLEARSIVDYSLLVETYEGIDVQNPGPQCVSLTGCFSNTSEPCRVLCLNIIDYTLKYDTAYKAFESKVIRSKWDDYEEKAKHFAMCIGDMGFGAAPDSSDAKEIVHFRYKRRKDQPCQSYGDLLCNKLKVTNIKDCEFSHFGQSISDCDDPTCVVEGADAHICKPFLTPACEDKIAGAKVGHVGWHIVSSIAQAHPMSGGVSVQVAAIAAEERKRKERQKERQP